MDKKVILKKLKTLADDINSIDQEASKCLYVYNEALQGRDEYIKNLYAEEFAPVKTSVVTGFSRNHEMRIEVYEDFISGYDEFLKSTLIEYHDLIERKTESLYLLAQILSLPFVCSRLLYLSYVRKFTVAEVCENLYMSVSTYYRYRGIAIQMLLDRLNNPEIENEEDDPDDED